MYYKRLNFDLCCCLRTWAKINLFWRRHSAYFLGGASPLKLATISSYVSSETRKSLRFFFVFHNPRQFPCEGYHTLPCLLVFPRHVSMLGYPQSIGIGTQRRKISTLRKLLDHQQRLTKRGFMV